MNLTSFLFYFFEAVAALSAVSILFVRNVFYGALYLLVCLVSIAAIYVLAFAEFIAVTQIIVYAGGILVLIIFGIMLTSRISGKPLCVTNKNWFAGLIVGVFCFSFFIVLFSRRGFAASQPTGQASENTIQSIGILLMSDFVLPFEIAGILLLIALIGSAVTASFIKPKS